MTDLDQASDLAPERRIPLTPLAQELLVGTNFAVVATTSADGSLQQSVVWVRERDGDVLFSTVEGRVKYQNMARDPNASVLVIDRTNGYRYSAIRGVAHFEEVGANDLISELSQKYTGELWVETQSRPRVVVVVTPTRISDYQE